MLIHGILEFFPNLHIVSIVSDSLQIDERPGGWVLGSMSFPYMQYTMDEVRDDKSILYSEADVIGDFNVSVAQGWVHDNDVLGTRLYVDPHALAEGKVDFAGDLWGFALTVLGLITRRQFRFEMGTIERLKAYRRGVWKIPALWGQSFLIDFLRMCSATPTLRMNSKEMLELLIRETIMDPSLFKPAFQIDIIATDELQLPIGLDCIEIRDSDTYSVFVGANENAYNDAVECQLRTDAFTGEVGEADWLNLGSENCSAGGHDPAPCSTDLSDGFDRESRRALATDTQDHNVANKEEAITDRSVKSSCRTDASSKVSDARLPLFGDAIFPTTSRALPKESSVESNVSEPIGKPTDALANTTQSTTEFPVEFLRWLFGRLNIFIQEVENCSRDLHAPKKSVADTLFALVENSDRYSNFGEILVEWMEDSLKVAYELKGEPYVGSEGQQYFESAKEIFSLFRLGPGNSTLDSMQLNPMARGLKESEKRTLSSSEQGNWSNDETDLSDAEKGVQHASQMNNAPDGIFGPVMSFINSRVHSLKTPANDPGRLEYAKQVFDLMTSRLEHAFPLGEQDAIPNSVGNVLRQLTAGSPPKKQIGNMDDMFSVLDALVGQIANNCEARKSSFSESEQPSTLTLVRTQQETTANGGQEFNTPYAQPKGTLDESLVRFIRTLVMLTQLKQPMNDKSAMCPDAKTVNAEADMILSGKQKPSDNGIIDLYNQAVTSFNREYQTINEPHSKSWEELVTFMARRAHFLKNWLAKLGKPKLIFSVLKSLVTETVKVYSSGDLTAEEDAALKMLLKAFGSMEKILKPGKEMGNKKPDERTWEVTIFRMVKQAVIYQFRLNKLGIPAHQAVNAQDGCCCESLIDQAVKTVVDLAIICGADKSLVSGIGKPAHL
ncbi:unnamed protein product, partial [Mesorhabditis spiculigera]